MHGAAAGALPFCFCWRVMSATTPPRTDRRAGDPLIETSAAGDASVKKNRIDPDINNDRYTNWSVGMAYMNSRLCLCSPVMRTREHDTGTSCVNVHGRAVMVKGRACSLP